MRKATVAILAAGTLSGLAVAGAAGFTLNIGGNQNLKAAAVGETTFQLAQCQDVFSLVYTVDETGITQVVASGTPALDAEVPAYCAGPAVTAALKLGGTDWDTTGTYLLVEDDETHSHHTWTFAGADAYYTDGASQDTQMTLTQPE